MNKKLRPLIVTGLVIVAIFVFVIYQKNTQSSERTKNTFQTSKVVIAYQTGIDPTKVAQAEGTYEKNSQRMIEWKKFDTGADVVNALASGDVSIGNIGTSPLAAATSRNLPIEVFLIVAKLGRSEALVVRNNSNIQSPQDLVGKTIAVPFVSTAHYSLLSALKHWNIDESQVKIVNLRPPEISAAWERGDIDATYVWEPALSKAALAGKVLTDSKQVADWGAPTFDVWVVRKDFAEKNGEFLKSFVKTSLSKIDEYNKDPEAFQNNSTYIQNISEITGSDPKDIPLLLSGNIYLDRKDQQYAFEKEFAQNILDTANFLKTQSKVDQVKPDYQENVTTLFLQP